MQGSDGTAIRASSGSGRPPIPEARIIEAAVALIDEQGAEALTLRSLAERLGGSTATLYRHFENRSSLVDGVVDAVFAEVDLADPDRTQQPWPVQLSTLATSLFQALERHRNIAPLMLERIRTTRSIVEIREHTLALLLANDFTPREAVQAYATIGRYVLGFGVQTRIDGSDAPGRIADPPASAERYPASAAVASVVRITLAEEFQYGLELMLVGLQAARPVPDDPGREA